MANLPVLSGAGATVYLKGTGAGSDADPFVLHRIIDTLPANTVAGSASMPAGTAHVGSFDVDALVGDDADLDSGAGVDDHALVAIGLPASGGHVVGGTPGNPFRFDPVASTVQPFSLASAYVPIVALASLPNVSGVKIASWYPGADVVASVIGNPAMVGSVHVSNHPFVPIRTFTTAPFGLATASAHVIASCTAANKRLYVAGYSLTVAGTQYWRMCNGTINAGLTGTMFSHPGGGIARQPIVPTGSAHHALYALGSLQHLILELGVAAGVGGDVTYYEE
mgnify:CR=1 FL=1